MKTRIANFNFDTGSFPLVEINMRKVHIEDNSNGDVIRFTAKTEHTVASVKMVDGVEVVKVLNKYNHPFEYLGGNPFTEAFASLNAYLADPAN